MNLRVPPLLLAAILAVAGCGGRPVHVARPSPDPRPDRPPTESFGNGIPIRVGLFWEEGVFEFGGKGGFTLAPSDDPRSSLSWNASKLRAEVVSGSTVLVRDGSRRVVWRGTGPLRVEPKGSAMLTAGARVVRGSLVFSARSDSLFCVNEVPLEDYLRGVVPKEIGPRPMADLEAVAAQAVAARTYTVRRLGQYNSLPFDVFASVQDQVYDGVAGEHHVADAAIEKTRGMVLADRNGLIEAFYSSTCGGARSDIEAVWPHRESHRALRGGPDGGRGTEWCRESRHFAWEESWTGYQLSGLVRKYAPFQLELPPGSIRGELVDLTIRRRGPSGRIAELEYVTTEGRWVVPGDRNRWILRRPGGGILRSVWIDLDVERRGGKVVAVTARGRGNGHGVGMCQMGALGRARAGQSWTKVLHDYYPGVEIRPIRRKDLPEGRSTAL